MAVLTYEVYLMNVPFNSDYKHIVYFNNTTTQVNTFKSLSMYHYTNLNVIVKNNIFILSGRNSTFDKCNYMMYKSSDDSRWYYAFIDEVLYDTYKGTAIYHTLDVWQTYHTSATFNESFIERAHIARSDDTPFSNTLPEPFNFSKVITKELTDYTTFSNELKPYYVLHALGHIPAVVLDDTPLVVAVNGMCGGVFTHACFGATTPSALEVVVNTFANTVQPTPLLGLPVMYRDARYALEYCNIVPFFTTDGQNHVDIEDRLDNHVTSIQNVFKDIATGTTMACGYTPKNKKLYNAQFQVLSVNTGNGLHSEFDMSLFKDTDAAGNPINVLSSVNLQLSGSCGADGDFYVTFPYYTYATKSAKHIRVNYGASLSLGYDQSNSGEYRQQRQINAMTKLASLGISLASGMGSINAGVNAATGSFNNANPVAQQHMVPQLNKVADTANLQRTTTALSSINEGINSGIEFANQAANEAQLLNIGNNTDQLDMGVGTYMLNVELNSIRKNEAQMIDKYFERYGYNISRYGSIRNYMNTRNKWNYIKTRNCVIDIKGPNNDAITFNKIFDTGTTVWHNINNVGDYSLNNN